MALSIYKDADGKVCETKTKMRPLPNKIYGDLEDFTSSILTAFNHLDNNIGVLLNGLKGSGKTLLANMICQRSELPVYVIAAPIYGDELMSHIRSEDIGGCVVFIDEFEKVYEDRQVQESFLPVLDGAESSKILFVFTSNVNSISEFMLNRMGRIRYYRSFAGLDWVSIEEIITDNLAEEAIHFRKELERLLRVIGEISFDNLKGLIQELNICYDKDFQDVVKYLNIRIERQQYKVTLMINNGRHETMINYHPLSQSVLSLDYKEGEGWNSYKHVSMKIDECIVMFSSESIRITDTDNNLYIFKRIDRTDGTVGIGKLSGIGVQ